MLSFILTIILALVISFLFTMDAGSVTFNVAKSTFSDIPLFYIVFVSVIIGALLACVTTIINLIMSNLTIMGKNSDLKKSYKVSGELQGKVDKLEEDKSVLKEQLKDSETVPK